MTTPALEEALSRLAKLAATRDAVQGGHQYAAETCQWVYLVTRARQEATDEQLVQLRALAASWEDRPPPVPRMIAAIKAIMGWP